MAESPGKRDFPREKIDRMKTSIEKQLVFISVLTGEYGRDILVAVADEGHDPDGAGDEKEKLPMSLRKKRLTISSDRDKMIFVAARERRQDEEAKSVP